MIWRGAGKLTLVLGMALQLAIPVEALAQNNNFYRQQQWQQQQQLQRQQEMQRQQAMRQQQMLRDQQMRQQQAQRQMQMQRQRAWQQPRSQPGFRPQQGVQRPQQAQGGFRIFRSPQQQGQQYGRPLPRQQAANQNRFSIFRSPSQQPAARLWRNNPQSQNALAAQRRSFFNAARGVTVRSGQFLRASYSARAADARRWLSSRTVTAQRGSNNGGARAWFAQWRGKFSGPKVVAGGNGSNGGNGGRRPPFSAQIAANDNKAYEGKSKATGFRGSRGFELQNPSFQPRRNQGGKVGQREYSGHAFDQMQNRGIMPSVVENTIKTGKSYSTRPGTTGYYDKNNNITVIVNSKSGRVITVITGGNNGKF
ncbi:DUF4258 domain-containing protein [Phenylobacterium sp.]|uniref:DUF4258 domain-containing protein n=1 Tax=Phenylobacterium sp. TaxID=1871053 RepID=UPI0035B24F39